MGSVFVVVFQRKYYKNKSACVQFNVYVHSNNYAKVENNRACICWLTLRSGHQHSYLKADQIGRELVVINQ